MQHFIPIVVLLSAIITISNADRDLVIGDRQSGDNLIEQRQVEKDAWPFMIVEKTETIMGDGNSVITRVEIIDTKKQETSAKAAILSGGPGMSYVTVKFESERGHGIHYIIKVYGKRGY